MSLLLRKPTERDREVRRLIGENIRTARGSQGRSIAWLAAEVGVSDSKLSRIELGQQVITTDILDRIALTLDTTVMSLYRRPEGRTCAQR